MKFMQRICIKVTLEERRNVVIKEWDSKNRFCGDLTNSQEADPCRSAMVFIPLIYLEDDLSHFLLRLSQHTVESNADLEERNHVLPEGAVHLEAAQTHGLVFQGPTCSMVRFVCTFLPTCI